MSQLSYTFLLATALSSTSISIGYCMDTEDMDVEEGLTWQSKKRPLDHDLSTEQQASSKRRFFFPTLIDDFKTENKWYTIKIRHLLEVMNNSIPISEQECLRLDWPNTARMSGCEKGNNNFKLFYFSEQVINSFEKPPTSSHGFETLSPNAYVEQFHVENGKVHGSINVCSDSPNFENLNCREHNHKIAGFNKNYIKTYFLIEHN